MLSQQDEGASGMAALPLCDLVERAAQMNRSGARALLRTPGDRPLECPIQLEGARAVAIARECRPEWPGQPLACQSKHLARRHITDHDGRIGQSPHWRTRDDPAAVCAQAT